MPVSPKDIRKLEQVMRSADGRASCPQRYRPGAAYAGIYRILELWPDRLAEVETTDGEWRENAVTYLEVGPLYFRSGYDKAQLLRRLKRAELSADHKKRLRQVALTAVESARSVEFRQYCQLAVRLASKEMMAALSGLAQSSDVSVVRRARWMREHVAEGLKGAGRKPKPAKR